MPKKAKFKGVRARYARHFRYKIALRYGLDLSNDDILNIVDMIQNDKSQHLRSRSNTKTVHKINYMGKEILLGYSKSLEIPVTAFTRKNNDYEEELKQVTETEYERAFLGEWNEVSDVHDRHTS